ncbi:MAG: dihydrolipoyl dehydrogenase [Bacteroidota bacterium]
MAKKLNDKKELVILGAGPGGYAAAFLAADKGLNVTVIDPEENPGGVCLYRGCIPTKALLYLSEVIRDAEEAGDMGVTFGKPDINHKKVNEWKIKVVKQLTGGLGQLSKARKIEHIRGRGKFISDEEIEITPNDGKKQTISFEKCIIATGSSPVKLPMVEKFTDRIMNSAIALEVDDIPKHLLIVGGGYIGLEMGTIYSTLGAKISLVEATDNYMPGMDKELIRHFKKGNKDLFEEEFFKTQLSALKELKTGVKVTLKNEKEEFEKKYDKVLIAVGQMPNTKNIGLEEAGVETNEKGFISIDDHLQTSKEKIYAIGDVTQGPLLAHRASAQGRVAVEHILEGKAAFDVRSIPAVVYTNPEIATCGMTEEECKEKGIEYKVTKFPWSALGKAVSMNAPFGVTKLIIEKETERVLGGGMVGKHAGDLIPELTLAVEMAAVASDLSLTIHPHPTLSESIMEAAEGFFGAATHFKGK